MLTNPPLPYRDMVWLLAYLRDRDEEQSVIRRYRPAYREGRASAETEQAPFAGEGFDDGPHIEIGMERQV